MTTTRISESLPLTSGFITPKEAAEYLNRSYSHIMHMLERGEMNGAKLLDRWLISPTWPPTATAAMALCATWHAPR